MTRNKRPMLTTAAILLGAAFAPALLCAPALAHEYDFTTTDGPLHLRVFGDGDVSGYYPERRGSVHGHVDEDGAIHGVWLQPRSDHPCDEMRHGTYAWGSFYLQDPFGPRPAGWWGYCGEQPRRDWELQPD